MPDTPTPGQVCYEAYMTTQYAHMGKPFDPTQPGWHYLSLERRDHRAWEAAAQAVITAWIASPDWPTPAPQPEEEAR